MKNKQKIAQKRNWFKFLLTSVIAMCNNLINRPEVLIEEKGALNSAKVTLQGILDRHHVVSALEFGLKPKDHLVYAGTAIKTPVEFEDDENIQHVHYDLIETPDFRILKTYLDGELISEERKEL